MVEEKLSLPPFLRQIKEVPMPFFETSVQEIKYKVLKKVAELAYEDRLTPENVLPIPEEIIPEGKATMRC